MADDQNKQMSYVQALDGSTEAAGRTSRWQKFCHCCRTSSDEYYRQLPWPDVESRMKMEQLLTRRRWFFVLYNLALLAFIIFMIWNPSSEMWSNLASLTALLFIVLILMYYWVLHLLGNHSAETFSPYRNGGMSAQQSRPASVMV